MEISRFTKRLAEVLMNKRGHVDDVAPLVSVW
jgi:hypothetical protein